MKRPAPQNFGGRAFLQCKLCNRIIRIYEICMIEEMMTTSILEVKNLCISFGKGKEKIIAVDGIDFSLSRGETLGIVGESGSGKSVTALSIMRLLDSPPAEISSGVIRYRKSEHEEINLADVPYKSMRHYRGKEIAMIFQEPMTSLNPVFRCGKQVTEAIRQHQDLSEKQAKIQAIELFAKVKLPRPELIFDSYPHQISGGQKQRVMIAMAISCNPAILIADEPTTALDVTVQKEILKLLRELKEARNMSMIFISHDLGVIAEIADRVLVMYRGRIVETGRVKDIFENPIHPYTKGLLACRPKLDRLAKVLPVIADFMNSSGKTMGEKTGMPLQSEGNREEEETSFRKRQEMLASSPVILEVSGLNKWYSTGGGWFKGKSEYVKAVHDVSFQVQEGETMGLVGESGCGKTTLGRSIVRLLDPTSGEIRFRGVELSGLTQSEMRPFRKQMQIVFQDPYSSLNPRMTIGNAILEPMIVHKLHGNAAARKKKLNELLELVGLEPGHASRFPHEFSGGQRQRICIARALAVEPQFLVCDESVSALDVSVQAQVLNLLNRLKSELKLTYIFISHDLSVVKFMSDRIIVMNEGRIEEMGYSEDVYRNPKSEYTRKLIASIPGADSG